jgi:hypothetical protein
VDPKQSERGDVFPMTIKERNEKIKQGLLALKEAGVVAVIKGDTVVLEIITEKLSIVYNTGEPVKLIMKDKGVEFDLSEYMRINTLHFAGGMPVIRLEVFPEKLTMYPEKVKVVYGE